MKGLKLDILSDFGICNACVVGKYYRVFFSSESAERVIKLFGLVYSNVCGLLSVLIGGKIYFLLFIDDYSRFTVIYFFKRKSEILFCFMEYKVWAENKTEYRFKVLRSDNGGEYVSVEFQAFISVNGISRQLTNVRIL